MRLPSLSSMEEHLHSGHTDIPSERNGSTSDDPIVHPHCNQIRARKRRQLASRTKTGCRTCRKRKKKCDEAKPKCKNCVQGNFECAGYTKPIPWSKDNAVQAFSALDLHQRLSSAAALATSFRVRSVMSYTPRGVNRVRRATQNPQCPAGSQHLKTDLLALMSRVARYRETQTIDFSRVRVNFCCWKNEPLA